VSAVRWEGISLNYRRSSDTHEIRKIAINSAPPDANLGTPLRRARSIFSDPAIREKFPRGVHSAPSLSDRQWAAQSPPGFVACSELRRMKAKATAAPTSSALPPNSIAARSPDKKPWPAAAS
jgi:hypothetical protein